MLSTADTALRESRLDVIEPRSGDVLATFTLETPFPTIAVTRSGVVHVTSSAPLLARARVTERPPVPAFRWPTPDGEYVTDTVLHGRVTIVNAWASWCAPCREEMPALVEVWESLADSGLAFLAVNEDTDPEAARRWLREEGLDPPVLLARGRARRTLYYPGLPYTMVVGRDGRIARRWIGYLGPQQIGEIRATVRRELGVGSNDAPGADQHHGHTGAN